MLPLAPPPSLHNPIPPPWRAQQVFGIMAPNPNLGSGWLMVSQGTLGNNTWRALVLWIPKSTVDGFPRSCNSRHLHPDRGYLDVSVDVEAVVLAGQHHRPIVHQGHVEALRMLHLEKVNKLKNSTKRQNTNMYMVSLSIQNPSVGLAKPVA